MAIKRGGRRRFGVSVDTVLFLVLGLGRVVRSTLGAEVQSVTGGLFLSVWVEDVEEGRLLPA